MFKNQETHFSLFTKPELNPMLQNSCWLVGLASLSFFWNATFNFYYFITLLFIQVKSLFQEQPGQEGRRTV